MSFSSFSSPPFFTHSLYTAMADCSTSTHWLERCVCRRGESRKSQPLGRILTASYFLLDMRPHTFLSPAAFRARSLSLSISLFRCLLAAFPCPIPVLLWLCSNGPMLFSVSSFVSVVRLNDEGTWCFFHILSLLLQVSLSFFSPSAYLSFSLSASTVIM